MFLEKNSSVKKKIRTSLYHFQLPPSPHLSADTTTIEFGVGPPRTLSMHLHIVMCI